MTQGDLPLGVGPHTVRQGNQESLPSLVVIACNIDHDTHAVSTRACSIELCFNIMRVLVHPLGPAVDGSICYSCSCTKARMFSHGPRLRLLGQVWHQHVGSGSELPQMPPPCSRQIVLLQGIERSTFYTGHELVVDEAAEP